jgi:desulfoferrodoxin (superoxide reductase-like protein)
LLVNFLIAHPPAGITAQFDPDSHLLSLEIPHAVSNPQNHFIDQITIYLNDIEIIRQAITLQSEKQGEKLSYIIPDAKLEDSIKITANCSKFGSKSTTLKITKD